MGLTQMTATVRTEPSPKRVRALIGGVVVADSRRAVLMWEKPYYPTYYLHITDVRGDLLRDSATITHCPYKGAATGGRCRSATRCTPTSPGPIRHRWRKA
ncbi:hypothetical protein BH24ACT11_BH24ACT11_10850 [soil metagenome]